VWSTSASAQSPPASSIGTEPICSTIPSVRLTDPSRRDKALNPLLQTSHFSRPDFRTSDDAQLCSTIVELADIIILGIAGNIGDNCIMGEADRVFRNFIFHK
jgi:hypothetical protein